MPSRFLSASGSLINQLLAAGALLVVGWYLLSWNERWAIEKSRSLSEVADGLRTIPADEAHANNDGKFVHLTGKLETTATLQDPLFGVSGNYLKLQRNVEMYQWTQFVTERTRNTPNGSSETHKEFTYARNWSNAVVDSSKFDQPQQYPNPDSIPYPAWSGQASEAQVGAFHLSSNLLAQDNEFSDVKVTETDLEKLSAELKAKVRLHEGVLFVSKDPANPQVGDVRVRFQGVPTGGVVSILGRQTGDSLGPFPTSLGQTFEILRPGKYSADRMFSGQVFAPSQAWPYWLGRGVAFAALAGGCWLAMPHVTGLSTRVPLLRTLLGGSWRISAVVLAAAFWLLIIGSEWMNDRTFVAICCWLLALGLLVSRVLTRFNRGAKAA